MNEVRRVGFREEEVSLLMVCHTKEKTHQDLLYLDTGCSNQKVTLQTKGNSTHSIFNVFFVPDLKTNLLSVKLLRKLGMGVNCQLIIFGCIAYAHIADEKRKKLDDKGEKCIFLSVSDQSKAYKLYNPITKKIVISRDVVFDEERTWSWNINTVEQRIPTTFNGDGVEIMQQPLHHLVLAAFLHGELQEQVFIDQPPGYVKFGCEHKVYKLKKALYGLKQALRAWYSRIDAYFQKESFQKCPYEHTLYTKSRDEGKMLIVCLYMDDLIYTGNDSIMVEKFKENMMLEFDMSDLGKMHSFLGLEVVQSIAGVLFLKRNMPKKF
ncbi:hypothetical protein ACOSP7_004110 [Xanthoceras sorbifolium]